MEGQFRKLKEIEGATHHLVSTERKTSQANKTRGARGTYILESTEGRTNQYLEGK